MGIRLPGKESTAKKPEAESPIPMEAPTPQNPVEQIKAPLEFVGQDESKIPEGGISQDILNEFVGKAETPVAKEIPKQILDEVVSPPTPDLYAPKVLARSVDPVQTKNILDVSEKLGVTPKEASALLGSRSREELLSMPELRNIEKDYPGLSTWARDPDNYKMLEQDPKYLKLLEDRTKKMKPSSSSTFNYVEDASKVFMQTLSESINAPLGRLGALVYSVVALPQNIAVEVMGRPDLAVRPPGILMDNPITKYYEKEAKKYAVEGMDEPFLDSMTSKISSGDYASAGRELSLRLIQQSPMTVTTILGAIAGMPMAALVGMGALQGTSTLKDSFDKGAKPTQSTLNSLYSGAAEVLFEKIELDAIFGLWSKKLAQEVGQDAAKKTVREAAKNIIKAFAIEGTSESMTELTQSLSAYTTGVDPKALENIGTKMAEAGILGGFSGSTVTTIGAITNAAITKRRDAKIKGIAKRIAGEISKAQTAANDADTLASMREDKKASPTIAENPQQTKSAVDSITGGQPSNDPDQVLPSDGKPAYGQLNINEISEVAKSLGITTQELARKLGPEALSNYENALKVGAPQFDITLSDYYRYSEDIPELDDLIYINGSEYNGKQGKQDITEGGAFFEQEQGPPIEPGTDEAPPTDEGIQFIPPTEEPQEGDPVLRRIVLLQASRSKEEQDVFRSIKNKIMRSTDGANINPEFADVVAETQFQHTRFRAEQLGMSVKDTAAQLDIGFQSKIPADPGWVTRGYFRAGYDFLRMPRNKIIFSKSSRINTVIHEFAHSWLHNMSIDWDFISGLSNRTEGQEEYYQAMLETAKLYGLDNIGMVKDANQISQSKRTAIHESFAQTAEKYMLEGSFEKSRYQKIFEGIKKWMATVADIVAKTYPQYPALEISPEVSRLFQTILNGNNKVEEQMGLMFPEPMFNPELLGAKADEYRKAILDARDLAIAQMYGKFFNRSYKERENLINANLDRIYNEAEAEIEATPAIVLMRSIQSGGPEAKITYSSIQEFLAGGDPVKAEAIKNLPPKNIIAGQKKVGIDVRDVMKMLEISDPNDMINIFYEMGQRDVNIEKLANKKIETDFPILKTDEEIHDESVKAINNEGRDKVINLELKILAENNFKKLQKMSGLIATPAEYLSKDMKEIVKNRAIQIVLDAKALSFKPADLLRAANRSGREASRAMVKGDFEMAFTYKQEEAINYYAYKQAVKTAVELNKTLKLMKRFSTMDLVEASKRMDVDYVEFAKQIIQAMTTNRGIPMLDPSEFRNTNIMDISKVEAINSRILMINTSLVGKTTADISVESFMLFGDVLRILQHTALASRKIEKLNLKENADMAGASIANELGPRRASDPKEPMNKGIPKWNASLKNVSTLFAGMFDSSIEYGKSTISAVIQSIKDAEAKFISEKNIDEKKLVEAVTAITKNNPQMQTALSPLTKRISRIFGTESGRDIAAPELNHIFKEAEIHQIMLYLGSESGKLKFAMGGFTRTDGTNSGPLGYFDLTTGEFVTPALDAQIEQWIKDGILTKEHFDFYQTVWDIYARHYPKTKEAVRYVDGFEIGEIQSREITTPWGTYKGGYVPLSRDAAYKDARTSVADFSTDNSSTPVNQLFPFTNMSLTRARSEKYYPLSLNLSALRSNLNAVYRITYMRPTMFDAGKIFDSEDFRNSLESRRPGAMNEVIKPWFQRTMAQNYTVTDEGVGADSFDQVARYFRKSVRVKSFLFNHVTWMKQYLGLVPALTKIDARILADAALEVRFRPSRSVAKIAELSPRMAVRFANNQRLAIKAFEDFTLQKDWINKFDELVEKATYAPIQFAQNHVDAIIFTAAVQQAMKSGMTNEQQIYGYAADVVEATQMSANVSNRPSIMHTSETKKLATDFMSVPLAMYGLVSEEYERTMDTNTKNRAKVLTFTLLMTSIVPSILGTIMSNPGKLLRVLGDEEEPDDEFYNRMSSDVVSDLRDNVFPVSGRIAWSVAKMDITSAFPLFSAARPIGKSVKALGKEEITQADYLAMLDSITILTQIPTSVLSRGFKTLVELNPDLDPNR